MDDHDHALDQHFISKSNLGNPNTAYLTTIISKKIKIISQNKIFID